MGNGRRCKSGSQVRSAGGICEQRCSQRQVDVLPLQRDLLLLGFGLTGVLMQETKALADTAPYWPAK